MRVRRTGMCAAFALVCSMMYSSAAWGVYQREFVNQEDFSVGSREGVNFASQLGGLTLSHSTSIVPFVWAPSPADSTVSKIDARHGSEIARYRVSPKGERWAPCAVASDADGNAYVACVAPGKPGKIVVILAKGGMDRNKDSVISTSGDYNQDSSITPSEILAWGADEMVGLVGEVGGAGTSPTALINDGKGQLWVALYEQCQIAKIDIKTGRTLAVVPVVGSPSTMLLSPSGDIWVLSTQNRALTQIDLKMEKMASYHNLDFVPGGMCITEQGTLWLGNNAGGLVSFDTKNGTWAVYQSKDAPGVISVALGSNGDIWAACPWDNVVAHFCGADGSVMSRVPTGKSVSSISTDADGYVWALRDGDSGACKIDPREARVIAVAQTGTAPFSGTAFASSITERGFLPSGRWRTVVDTQLDGAGWGRLSWEGCDGGGRIKVDVRSGDSPLDLLASTYRTVINGDLYNGTDGRFLEVVVTLEGPGNMTPTLHGLRIEGRNRPPDVSKATVNMPRIGRLDHVMESVTVMDITDPEGDPVKVVVTGVSQDEPVANLSPTDKFPDAILTGGSSVWLRGECDPGTPEKPGNGRVYTISFKATDSQGASSTGKLKVTVAPTIKVNDIAIEDKEKFDSTKEFFQNVAKAEDSKTDPLGPVKSQP